MPRDIIILECTEAKAEGKPGCPTDGLYVTTVRNKIFDRIAKFPVPEDPEEAEQVLALLKEEKCDRDDLLERYRKDLRKERASISSP